MAMNRQLGSAVSITAGGMFAVHVGGRATRDALFLSNYPFSALPGMIMVTAVVALALAWFSTRLMVRWGPDRVVPAAFAASAALLIVEWGIAFLSAPVAAVVLYLHAGAFGALLISGFWSVLGERLDPRSAKRQLGQITAAGTLGGLAGGLVAAQAAHVLPVAAMLPVLAVLHGVCAVSMARMGRATSLWRVVRPAAAAGQHAWHGAPQGAAPAGQSAGQGSGREAAALGAARAAARQSVGQGAGLGRDAGQDAPLPDRGDTGDGVESTGAWKVLASIPYIRRLALLVVLVTVADVLVDLYMKSHAKAVIPDSGGLLQFFAMLYMGVSVLTFLIQAFASRRLLEKMGPARAAAILPAGTALTAAGALMTPGLSSAVLARGSQSVLMNTLFGAGYEVLFTPVPARDKRAVKSLVDVGGSRLGDLLGAWIGQVAVTVAMPGFALPAAAIALSAAAYAVAHRLQRGYVDALARGLVTRAVHLELSDTADTITRTTLLRTLGLRTETVDLSRTRALGHRAETEAPAEDTAEARRARALASRDPATVRRALAEGPLPTQLLPSVVPLLGWDPVARDAIAALREAGSAAVEPLALTLLDPHAEFTVRRRAPLVLGTIADPRVVDALVPPLFDPRFEVRYRSGLALANVQTLHPAIEIPSDLIYAAVLREVETASGVWEGRSLLDQMDDEAWSPVMDELVRDRANRSLEHVFTLLALVLPRKPLRIAFRGLLTDDPLLRGTALEYLESTLPAEIRKPLWPYLEPERARRQQRSGEAVDELLKMNESIAIQLEELRRKE